MLREPPNTGSGSDEEASEWRDSLDQVLRLDGPSRCEQILSEVLLHARRRGLHPAFALETQPKNTIDPSEQPSYPGDIEIEERILAAIRWNAAAMVVAANRDNPGLGGHLSTYASTAELYEVGFHHVFRGDDMVFFQPHAAPGIYARAYLEGRLTEENLAHYRREVDGRGISAYPHPRLMPGFWQFPTGSMGLGPLMAVYQARFDRYLEHRGLDSASRRRVWAFVGDGEMDEPESIAGLTLAAREGLNNLTFVVNCNLQRLDGPVRGNGNVIAELERLFVGAGWNVIKVLWGSDWDSLFAGESAEAILGQLRGTVDGQMQAFGARDGAFNRAKFFECRPELRAVAGRLSDQEIDGLRRGGHDPLKIYAAYQAAIETHDRPTVILAHTKKGFGLPSQGRMSAHQHKSLQARDLLALRDRLRIPLCDERAGRAEFYKPGSSSPEMRYLFDRRKTLGGFIPRRSQLGPILPAPKRSAFARFAAEPNETAISTTVALVKMLRSLLRDPEIGERIVPIVADEARTFGMQALFRQAGLYSPWGQRYEPEDHEDLLFYREARDGQILEEGITEAGALASWIAAGLSYSVRGLPMLPFYLFYSAFGFRRVGDLMLAAADACARGFLIGATSGGTTLSGEGLQHQDNSSHLMAATLPGCRAYDPALAAELAVIVEHGMQRMLSDRSDELFYITVTNQNQRQITLPAGAERGVIEGMYQMRKANSELHKRVRLLGSGAILFEVLAAAERLETDERIGAEVWSVTSFTELRRRALDEPGESWVERSLSDGAGPVLAATDYDRALPDLIRAWVPGPYLTLGTDGFGRSDTRAALRRKFGVDAEGIAAAAVQALHER